jgi:arabinogalactan endo-1,4-beta-galactosidase
LGADVSALASGGRGGGGGFAGFARGRGPATAQAATPPATSPATSVAGRGGARGSRGGLPVPYNESGVEGTEYGIMLKHGWNGFRLRVFVDPVRQAGTPQNSLANTLPLAKAIKDAGGVFMLDIHYSDTWADPQHQETPPAWRDLDADALEKKVEEYSRDVISQFKAAGAMPEMVQVGNEITGGLLWPLGHLHVPDSPVKQEANERIQNIYMQPYDETRVWSNVTRFIKAGIRGVKAGAGNTPPKIILHIDCGGDWQVTQWWFDHIAAAGVEYDIIGQSFYPRYHGTLPMLQENMVQCAKRYNKPFMVVETGYPQTGGEQMMSSAQTIAKPVLSAADPQSKGFYQWPGTPQGQLQFMVDLVNTVKRAPNGAGVWVWAPEARGGGNGMWNADGTPAPSIFVLDHLEDLKSNPMSRLPAPQSP